MKRSRGRFYTAEQRWITAFGRFILNFINLETFYSTTVKALDSNKTRVEQEWRDGFKKAASDPTYSGLKKNSPFHGEEKLGEQFADMMGSRSVRLAKETVGAAALVFAHTLLDEALSDACWISFAAKPEDWFDFVQDRKVSIGQLRTQTVNESLKQLASDSIVQLERESMIKRVQRIHQICVPQLKGQAPATHWIELQKLERFDELRHRIIHDARFTRSIKTLDDDIFFAKQIGLSVFMLLHQTYPLAMDKLAEITTERQTLRVCAIIRREFPEICEFLEKNAEALADPKRREELRQLIADARNKTLATSSNS